MKIEMEFEGLKELVRAFEKAASDEEIKATNKKIVDKSARIVQRIMSRKIPRSKDISKSGRGFGTQYPVEDHAADSVPIEEVSCLNKDGEWTSVFREVGWTKSDKSEHFYVKFINWGTIYRPPQEFIFETGREADSKLQKIAEQEYQAFLDNTIK